MNKTITVKRRQPQDDAPKIKVLTRPLDEVKAPANGAPPPIAAEPESATGDIPLTLKIAVMDALATPAWQFVTIELSDDLEVATSLLEARLISETIDCRGFTARGNVGGLHVLQDDRVVGFWRYADMAKFIREYGDDGKPKKKRKPAPPSDDEQIAGAMDLRDDEPPRPSLGEAAKKSKPHAGGLLAGVQVAVGKLTVPPEVLKPPGRELAKTTSVGRMIELAWLQRHPENRTPADADVKARAESLQADGQLEDVVVRELAEDEYQIISGETRYLAAKSLGWTELRCKVIACDDAEASRLVGLHNGQRTDLNPIQKAQQIERMCQHAGVTREEAARSVGLESGSAASNLVRLLKLSKAWQERIASGELPATFARVIAAYAHVPKLMDELDQAWSDSYNRGECFSSREGLEEAIQSMLADCTRPVDDRERFYSWNEFPSDLRGDRPSGNFKCLLTPDELAVHHHELGITKLLQKTRSGPGGKKTKSVEIEVATNVELYDKLQIPHILALQAKKGKAKATAAGAATDAGEKAEKKKTPAQIKAAKEERAEQLGRAIDNWVETVMRREIAAALRAFKPTAKVDVRLLKLVLHFFATNPLHGNFDEELARALGVKHDWHDEPYTIITQSLAAAAKDTLCKGCEVSKWQRSFCELAAWAIGGDADDPRPASIDDDVLQVLFTEWGCTMEAAWSKLWAAKDPLVEEFLQLHRKEELAKLAWELVGTKYPEVAGKTAMITGMLGATRTPPLPKSLQPPKGKAGKGRGK